MTPSEVEKLARESGLIDWVASHPPDYTWNDGMSTLTRFAELIERAAMEKAAKIAEVTYEGTQENEDGGSTHLFGTSSAAAIRAAAQKQV